MKKLVMFGFVVFLLVLGLVFAASLSKEQKAQIKDCRVDCSDQKKASQKSCHEEGSSCAESCNEAHGLCIDIAKTEFGSCNLNCEQSFPFNNSMDSSQKRQSQQDQYLCKRECQRNFTQTKRQECNIGECKRECANKRSECIGGANEDQRFCSNSCQYLFLNSSITCENGRYTAGQTIWRDCDSCKCGFDGKLKCTQHASCNFAGLNETSQQECESAGGFYQELCQGNIYAMRCTEEFYCQCEGYGEYTCPEDQICLKEFKTHGILSGNLKTWSERRGLPLGEIGICAPIPEIGSCGNGVCEDVVVNSMAETALNCPVDCGLDACPDVCVPLWEIENNACVFNACGSGCGADNVRSFIDDEDCVLGLEYSCDVNEDCKPYYNYCGCDYECRKDPQATQCTRECPNKNQQPVPTCSCDKGKCTKVPA